MPRLAHGAVLAMWVEHHDGDVVLHQLLYQVAAHERLPPAGLGQDADVLLHHGVDVHLHPDVMAEQQAEVSSRGGVLLQPYDLLDQLVPGPEDGQAGLERCPRDLQEPALITVADHVDQCGYLLMYEHVLTLGDHLRPVQGQVGLPLHVHDLPQNPSCGLVLGLDVLHLLDPAGDAEVEAGGPHVPVDYSHGLRFAAIGGGGRACGVPRIIDISSGRWRHLLGSRVRGLYMWPTRNRLSGRLTNDLGRTVRLGFHVHPRKTLDALIK